MIVQTRKEAWELAKKMSEVEYHKDEIDSYYAGYPIYKNDINIQVADLGVRLEVKTDDYKITNIWIAEQIGEGITQEMEQEAEKLSDKFVFNYFNMNGKLSSKEFRKNTIFRIAAQALKKMKTANSTEELFDICHEAEILLEKEIKECQGYLTIFEPLTKVMFRWRREGKICHKKCYCTDNCTDKQKQKETEQEKQLETRHHMKEEYRKLTLKAIEGGAFTCTMSEQEINQSFAMMQFMSMTKDFMKKGIEIINELSKGMRGKE